MQKFGYKKLAKYYDTIYKNKNYDSESDFIIKLLAQHKVKTVLDVGCGTGSHILRLEKKGFECTGVDLNSEMLDVAKGKVKADLIQANMTDFSLPKRFDAIICMYATFNHNTKMIDAEETISCFKSHLNENGLLLIDLHNPLSSGKKIDKRDSIEREIEWNFDPKTKIEMTNIKFKIKNKIIIDKHLMRIYSIDEMKKLLKNQGFEKIIAYEGYGFERAKNTSKNLEIVGYL